MTSGIYSIWNLRNDKVYVGSGVVVSRRWGEHLSLLRRGIHHSQHLQRAYDTYGEPAFSFEIIENCPAEQLIAREQYWIDSLEAYGKNGYNVNPTAGSSLGVKRSEETRRKVSEAKKGSIPWNKGIARGPQTPEEIEKRIAPLRGKSRPPEVIAKISETKRLKGLKPSLEAREAARKTQQKNAELRKQGLLPTYMTPELRKRIGLAISEAKQKKKLLRDSE